MGHLKRHRAKKHAIEAQWHKCEECKHKVKTVGDLKLHGVFKHGIDVVWHQNSDCDYKAKDSKTLRRHQKINNKHEK